MLKKPLLILIISGITVVGGIANLAVLFPEVWVPRIEKMFFSGPGRPGPSDTELALKVGRKALAIGDLATGKNPDRPGIVWNLGDGLGNGKTEYSSKLTPLRRTKLP